MAITYTQADLDNLKEALVTGAEEVQIGEKKIKFRSQKDIQSLIKQIEAKLSNTSTTVSTTTIQATFKKGRC